MLSEVVEVMFETMFEGYGKKSVMNSNKYGSMHE